MGWRLGYSKRCCRSDHSYQFIKKKMEIISKLGCFARVGSSRRSLTSFLIEDTPYRGESMRISK